MASHADRRFPWVAHRLCHLLMTLDLRTPTAAQPTLSPSSSCFGWLVPRPAELPVELPTALRAAQPGSAGSAAGGSGGSRPTAETSGPLPQPEGVPAKVQSPYIPAELHTGSDPDPAPSYTTGVAHTSQGHREPDCTSQFGNAASERPTLTMKDKPR